MKELKRIEQKSSWSEEDEKIQNDLMWMIEAYRKNGFNKGHFETANRAENWLKSLKEKYTWKPSEGQLECLGYVIEKAEKDWSPLTNNRIYLTLKALKEQLEKL